MNARTDLLGVVYDMPLEDYLAVDALSATGLRLLSRSPWHYRNRIDIEPTRTMLRGTLAHCAVLEPDAMAARYVVTPENAPRKPSKVQWTAKHPSADSKAAMAWWTLFQEENAGRELVTFDEYWLCQTQLLAVMQQPELSTILRSGHGEVSVFWIDEQSGIYCKARPDWLNTDEPHAVVPMDLKTCVDESPSGFGRAAARLRYDLQAAHYTAGIEAAMRTKVDRFVFGAVTNKPPILAVPYVLTDEIRDQGRDERRELIERLAWCQREDVWPAYGAGIQMLDFPAYAKHAGEVEVDFVD